jgi:hypothetical protein
VVDGGFEREQFQRPAVDLWSAGEATWLSVGWKPDYRRP